MNSQTHRPLITRRQRRIHRRQQQIMDAAAVIFGEQGYAHTTTKAIAEAADMAEGTLYNYFKSKRDILLAILHNLQQEVDKLLDDVESPHGMNDPVATVEWVLQLLVVRIPLSRILLAESWADDAILQEHAKQRIASIFQRVKNFITGQINQGTFRRVDPELATKMVLGVCLAPLVPVIRGEAAPPTPAELHAMAVAAVDLMLHGLET